MIDPLLFKVLNNYNITLKTYKYPQKSKNIINYIIFSIYLEFSTIEYKFLFIYSYNKSVKKYKIQLQIKIISFYSCLY
jgi:hypothetical protein